MIAHFPLPGGRHMAVGPRRTTVVQPATAEPDDCRNEQRSYRTRRWGLRRIRTRQRRAVCTAPLPAASLKRLDERGGFAQLHEAYPQAQGDVCPHRGYDLRSVEPDADGYRQCPLHQLRVRCP